MLRAIGTAFFDEPRVRDGRRAFVLGECSPGRSSTEIGQLVNPHFHFAFVRTRIKETMSWPTRSTIRRWLMYWLVWTAVGLFYISQDFMTRMARSEASPDTNGRYCLDVRGVHQCGVHGCDFEIGPALADRRG